MEPAPPKPAAKKAVEIDVLRCLNPSCGALMGYEVTPGNVLYVDLAWQAEKAGEMRYFPCPKCGAKNVVEPFTDAKGKATHQVTRFEL